MQGAYEETQANRITYTESAYRNKQRRNKSLITHAPSGDVFPCNIYKVGKILCAVSTETCHEVPKT